ncbi:unnamed protein product, partial [Polarella glacialis]
MSQQVELDDLERLRASVREVRREAVPLTNQTLPPHVYEVWPSLGGRNRFFCFGRCLAGPNMDYHFQFITCCCLAVPCTFYAALCAPYLWQRVSPLLPLFTALMALSTVALLLFTACTDPGIIPRSKLQMAVPELAEVVAQATGTPLMCLDASGSQALCNITYEQEQLGYRWCTACRIIRPPRASHCRDCDNCVLRFDHHCPFVNNCVGQRNYIFFTGFLVSTGFLGVAVFSGIALWYSHLNNESPVAEDTLRILLVVIGIPAMLLMLGLIVLTAFHA